MAATILDSANINLANPLEDMEQVSDADIKKAVSTAVKQAIIDIELPTPLWPRLENLFDDVSRPPEGCIAGRDDVAHEIREFGDPEAKQTVVLFGDSHMGIWYDALLPIATKLGWKLLVFCKASCFPADLPMWRQDEKRAYTECDEYRAWALKEIGRLQPNKIVVAGLVRCLPISPKTGKPSSNIDGTKFMQNGITTMLRALQLVTKDIVLLSGTPYLEQSPLDYLETFGANKPVLSVACDPVTISRNNALRLAAQICSVNYVDLMPWFCKDQVCPLVIGNVIVYRDTNHVSKTYANILGTELARRIGL